MSAKPSKSANRDAGAVAAAKPLVHAPMGLKVVTGICMACLGAILVASFVYRVERPTLTVKTVIENPHGGVQGPGGGEGAGPMGMGQTPKAMTEMMEMMTQLKEKPNDFDLLMRLGERFLAMEFAERAVIFLERAQAVKPDDPDMLNALGVAYFQSNQPERAREKFERLLAIDKNDFRAHYNMGILLKHALSDPAGAKAHFAAVLASPQASDATKAQAKSEMEQ